MYVHIPIAFGDVCSFRALRVTASEDDYGVVNRCPNPDDLAKKHLGIA